ncbi:MAG: carbohydrate kinase family protein [Acidimicrobiia bacterium]
MLCCIGDLCEDIVIWPDGEITHGADTTAVISRRRGGSAANVAYFAAAVGTPSRFIGALGDDLGGWALTEEMTSIGVDVKVQRVGRTGTIVILVSGDGERTMITDRGAARDLTDVPMHWLDAVRWLHVPFYSLEVEPLGATTFALMAEARRRSIPISIDASSSSLLASFGVEQAAGLIADAIGSPDVLFANAEEDATLAGRWPADVIIVKHGPDPAMVRRCGEADLIVAVGNAIEPIDSTGAGDAFAAGVIGARLEGHDWGDAVRAGHGLAQRVLRSPGATLG